MRGGEEKKRWGGGCAEQREQWEDQLATRPGREDEQSQTNRGIGGGCMGVVPRARSKLSRALHAHRGKNFLQDLQNLENTATKRAMVRFKGARDEGAMAFFCGMPGVLARRHDGGPPVEVGLRHEPEVA